MAMSQRMLGIDMQSWVRKRLMQVPSIHGSHNLFLGVHWKVAAMMQATFQDVDSPPQT